MGIVTLEISGSEKYFIRLHYTKSHPNPDPDTFDIILAPEEVTNIDYFDEVVIKKDGVTEYVGFIEEITPEIGEGGLEYMITGRCYKLILWKKFTERFQESREVGPENESGVIESGFFGEVYPKELIKFILRCPISDNARGRIRQKIGWGICSDYWECCANETADCFYPQWVALRYSGLAWRGRGNLDNIPVVSYSIPDDPTGYDSTYTDWMEFGTTPYIEQFSIFDGIALDMAFQLVTTGMKEGYFIFADLPVGTIGIYTADLRITSRVFLGANVQVAVYLNDGVADHRLGLLDNPLYTYVETIFPVTTILNTVTKFNAAKIYFVIENDPVPNDINFTVNYAYLAVQSYTAAIYQSIGDWFAIDLGTRYNRVTGILIECRDNPSMYARNYKIQWIGASSVCDLASDEDGTVDAPWNDFDDFGSAINITNNGARDILHSWVPEDDVNGIRIWITESADKSWEISQVYIWQADKDAYRVMNE